MITRYRFSIGSRQLDQMLDTDYFSKAIRARIKDKLVILNIGYTAPDFSRTIETAGDNDGGIITRTYRQKATVTVTFGLYIYNTQERFEACQYIKTQIRDGGTIQTSDRPGQALYNCVCEQFPEIDSARDWTAPITMTFSSYSYPYWQSVSYDATRSLNSTPSGTSMSITPSGNAPFSSPIIRITANVAYPNNNPNYKGIYSINDTSNNNWTTPVNGELSMQTLNTSPLVTVRISSAKHTTTFRSFYPLAKGNAMVVDTDERNNLQVRVFTNDNLTTLRSSGYGYVLPDSSDKMMIAPGIANTVYVSAPYSTTVTIQTRGAWL